MKTELSYGVPNQKAFDDLVEILEREYFALRKMAKKNGMKRKNIEIHISKGISSILYGSTVCSGALKNSIIFTKNGKRYKVPVIVDEDIRTSSILTACSLHLTDIYMFDPDWLVQEDRKTCQRCGGNGICGNRGHGDFGSAEDIQDKALCVSCRGAGYVEMIK